MKINCLIVEDEPSSQKVLEKFIADINTLHLVAICNNAIEAMEKLNTSTKIDLIFLDINMPKISGLAFYKSLQNPPKVIFTTAYPQYAVDGFEVNAIDFLLKPFSFERFFTATNKAIEAIIKPETTLPEKSFILIKADKKLHKIKTADVLFIEALGDYVKIHLETKFLLTNNRFSKILSELSESNFIQTHKSFAVAMEKVQVINGNQITIQKHQIPIGQKYKSDFYERFKSTEL
jgi:DNA-binding LytR/AlgR family response regulator